MYPTSDKEIPITRVNNLGPAASIGTPAHVEEKRRMVTSTANMGITSCKKEMRCIKPLSRGLEA